MLLSFDTLTKNEIHQILKDIVKSKQDEALEIERILSTANKSKMCCMCIKNCNDCEINTSVEAHV